MLSPTVIGVVLHRLGLKYNFDRNCTSLEFIYKEHRIGILVIRNLHWGFYVKDPPLGSWY